MWVDNPHGLTAKLSRAPLDLNMPGGIPEFGPPTHEPNVVRFATIVVHEAYVLERGKLLRTKLDLPPALAAAMKPTVTNGTSVTVSAAVLGSTRAHPQREVSLSVAEHRVALVCSSPRRWQSVGGRMIASAPQPFEPFDLAWSLAYGGASKIPPGRTEDGLIHPEMLSQDPFNPMGLGHLAPGESPEGSPLPQIELADQLVSAPTDRPIPGGLSPCPTLAGMRWRVPFDPRTVFEREVHESPLLGYHIAPLYCVFDDLGPGTEIGLTGLSVPSRWTVPSPQSSVRWQSKVPIETGCRLRTIHLEGDAMHLLVQHTVLSSCDKLPTSAVIEAAS